VSHGGQGFYPISDPARRNRPAVQLAKATGISKQTVSNMVNGRRGISKANALKLAAYFRAPAETFLEVTAG
jgi:plasmid maintenance system antidote protein VapI